MGDLQTDLGGLSGIAGQLHSAADGMSGPSSQQSDPPNAGESTDVVCQAIESLSRASAALTETASKAGGDVDAAKATYGQREGDHADMFNNIQ